MKCLPIQKYLNCIEQGIIPDYPPESLGLTDFYKVNPRDFCTKRGLWTVIDRQWTKQLSKWIGKRKFLEIMAGGGWLSKALSEYGTKIIATDDYSWDNDSHPLMKRVYNVIPSHSLEAITTYQTDILLCSWPPYADEAMYRAARLWGNKKPIIMIGEGYGGCNATDEFFENFQVEKSIYIPQWYGIHDYIQIGYCNAQ